MAGEGGNIIRNVFGKSYKEAESITKDASKGALDFKSPQDNTFHGKKGGKKFDDYKEKKNQILLVEKIEGPLDDHGKKVDNPKEGIKYWFKATFNRSASKSEYKKLLWITKINGIPIPWIFDYSSISGNTQTIQVKIPCYDMRVYAYFKNPTDKVSVGVRIDNCSCDCKTPEENYPYSENTFSKIKEIKELIKLYAKKYSVPPVAIAGSIADEYNIINESNSAKLINWLQDDIVINFMPNFAIEFDVYVGGSSKLNNATKHDLGIGNIKLETAKKLYDQYQQEFKAKNWNYKDIVNYIQSNEGTVHLAALVIKKAQEMLEKYIFDYCECKKEAVLVTYYKQGENYINKFLQNKKQNPSHRIKPGEGCRVCLQRESILKSLS